MVQKDPQRDNLASEIEDAVDDLFSQYEAVSPKLEGEDEIADLVIEPVAEAKPVAPPAPKPPPAAPEPIMDLDIDKQPSLSMESEPAPVAPPSPGDTNAFEAMNEALMTVDWEISQPNVQSARKLLLDIKQAFPVIATDIAGQVASLMDKVLVSIGDSPTNAPVSAPGQLKRALQTLQTIANEGSISADSRQTLQQVSAGLQSSLPHLPDENGILELDDEPTVAAPAPAPPPVAPVEPLQVEPLMEADDLMAPEEPAVQPLSETQQFKIDADPSFFSDDLPAAGSAAVPFGLGDVLKNYIDALNHSIQRIVPMENIFAKASGTEKLHAINSKIRELLEAQVRVIDSVFSTDFGQATFPAGRLNNIDDFVKSQLAVLSLCIKRLKPLEDLFARTSGYEKLFKLNNRIRKSLETQRAVLTRSLSGDYTVRQQPQRAAAPVATSGAVPAQLQNILQAQIQELSQCIKTILPLEIFSGPAVEIENLQDMGRQLREKLERQKKTLGRALLGDFRSANAMGPSISPKASPWPILLKGSWGGKTVAFAPEQIAYQSKAISVKALKDLSYLPLAKLKTGLFSNIKKIVQGELAGVDKNVLKELEFPLISPPETFPVSMAGLKKATIVIIYAAGQGKALMLDSPLESVAVSEHGVWEPSRDPQSVFSGDLIVFGSSLPVITV